ncbi:hypothetical protein KR222_007026, partial [Zaprionus bogoriensis]
MAKYHYADLILEAFMEFRRPMTMDEVVEYVAEMANKSTLEVRLQVDNTLTAAWLHGFVDRDEEHLFSLPPDNCSVRTPEESTDKPGYTFASAIPEDACSASSVSSIFSICS